MDTKIDVSQLNVLRDKIASLLQVAYELGEPDERSLALGSSLIPVVIVWRHNELFTCRRNFKMKGDIEVFRVSKKDAEDGPLPKRADKYTVKLASFLERRGLYQSRAVITDETMELFEDEKSKRVKV